MLSPIAPLDLTLKVTLKGQSQGYSVMQESGVLQIFHISIWVLSGCHIVQFVGRRGFLLSQWSFLIQIQSLSFLDLLQMQEVVDKLQENMGSKTAKRCSSLLDLSGGHGLQQIQTYPSGFIPAALLWRTQASTIQTYPYGSSLACLTQRRWVQPCRQN